MSDSEKKPKSASAERFAERSSRIEEQIKEAQRRKQEQQFLEELSRRITIGREGRTEFEKNNFSEAIAKYRRFLSITARSLNVEIEELRPALFEAKIRAQESLLISAILLDLCKILDKLKTPSALEERRLYQRLYITFTVGQNFQGFAAENLRKYILYGGKNLQHKPEFWALYNSIRIKRFCIVATTLFGDSAPETAILREWRDQHLYRSAGGRAFINSYYRIGPSLVGVLHSVPVLARVARVILRKWVRLLAN